MRLPGPVTLESTEVGSQCSTKDFNFGKIYPVGNKRRSLLHFKSIWTEHVYGKKRGTEEVRLGRKKLECISEWGRKKESGMEKRWSEEFYWVSRD